ncbi:MAG: hypothetical protein ACRDD1_13495, partial [Planctomycetia bacterium]
AAVVDAAVRRTKSALLVDYAVAVQVRGGRTDEIVLEMTGVDQNQAEVQVLGGSAALASQIVVPAGEPAENRRRWRLKFDRELLEPVVLRVHVEKPAPGAEPAVLPPLAVVGAVRQAGTVAVEGEDDQQVMVDAVNLRTIDPSELPALPGHAVVGRLVGSFQYRQLPFTLKVSTSNHEALPVLTAVCPNAELATVVDGGGLLRTKARYIVHNLGLQHLRMKLPEGSVVLAALRDGAPTVVRREKDEFLIGLPAARGLEANSGAAADGSATVEVVVFYQSEAAGLTALGRLRQPPPKLNVPVLKMDWRVYVPRDQAVVASNGGAHPAGTLTRDSLVGRLRGLLTAPGGRRVFNPLELLSLSCSERRTTFSRVASDLSRPADGVASVENYLVSESDASPAGPPGMGMPGMGGGMSELAENARSGDEIDSLRA